jgi:hypothetical protein
MPIRNADDDVIGVAEVMHKIRNGSVFTKDDEKVGGIEIRPHVYGRPEWT